MISVDRLTKVYGPRVAVWRLTFEVAPGEILGFLGPNGAGKTTTMRMLTGFLPPSSGSAKIAGHDVVKDPLAAKASIGYLCEMPPVYLEMTVGAYLDFVAAIKRVPPAARKAAIARAIELAGLVPVAHRVAGHLSKGYRQRVGLAQAILHRPKVLVLDEPTVGLDPRQITEMRRLIRGLAGEQTVILSTHILPEVAAVCSRAVIISEGQLVAEDSIENLTARARRTPLVRLRVARDLPGLAERLAAIPGVSEVSQPAPATYTVRTEGGDDACERVAAAAIAAGAGLLELSSSRASLEDVFLDLVTEESEEAPA
ncbi:MAG TPA: ATP-binding cassette domain-containing protein [Candidatus Polarisedimenticolaceae bacterium]|nr:ATP-binding cassette domain-containing protein [Candidatus Polarisedimenticolaceae bacterium]